MDTAELFVKILGEVGNFTEKMMGISVIDAYFGPEELSPSNQERNKDAELLIRDLEALSDNISESIHDPIRCSFLQGEVKSLQCVVEWLSGDSSTYSSLVEGLFHIEAKKFRDAEIDQATQALDEALSDIEGASLRERVLSFIQQGEITGNELIELIEGELQKRTTLVCQMFEDRVYSILGESVTDNGVEYQTVSDVAWSGYNYYQGGFKSINQFNIERSFNRHTLRSVIYHEYEHHVSNLWREKAYHDKGFVDLSIVPLHTGRCVVSEGTADTAKDFLGVSEEDPVMQAITAQYRLSRMVSINAALMLNEEGSSVEETVDYIHEYSMRPRDQAEASIAFLRPTSADGRPNIWSPYVFTYHFGRSDFVLPTFQKAKKKDKLPEFFRTVYLNTYSCSSVTWHEAFKWL
jgi:hypothetical protein